MQSVRVVCISDTHTMHDRVEIPDGDVIVHAGDATFRGYEHEVKEFGDWYNALPHTHKIFVAGNHDLSFQDQPVQALMWLNSGVTYLQDKAVELEINGIKLKIYGSPWQPEFCNWAFNLPRGRELKEKWDMIPKDTDILITHGPPYKNCDTLSALSSEPGRHIGCRELRKALYRVQPILHCVGHIHEGWGTSMLKNTVVANASICTPSYKPWNDPLVFDIFEDKTIRQVKNEDMPQV